MAKKLTDEKIGELATGLGITSESFAKVLKEIGVGTKTGRRTFADKERVIRTQDTTNPFPGIFKAEGSSAEDMVTYFYPDVAGPKGKMEAVVKYVLVKA